MSFNIALSGINASQKDLDVTSNNIANVATSGFKESRAEFADVYANSVFSSGKTAVGNGVQTVMVAQQFHQGSMKFTQNALDMGINGEGFFVTSEDQATLDRSFTRAGAFKMDSDNFVVTPQGQFLQAYPVDQDGNPAAVSMASTRPLQISTSVGSPTATRQVNMGFNLPSTGSEHNISDFNPDDSSTYTSATSVTVYDSLGESHVAQTFYVKDQALTNTWHTLVYVDDQPIDIVNGAVNVADPSNPNQTIPSSATMVFDASGQLDAATIPNPGPSPVETVPLTSVLTNGSDVNQTVTFSFNNPTQYAANFEVNALAQDGSTVGKLTSIDVGPDGLVKATYSNGDSQYMGKIAIAKFNNPQGLAQTGDTSWKATQDSGVPLSGEANTGTFGKIISSALEQSNVNLTEQLVNLISSQRNFQANSRALEVDSSLQQTIIQIR